MKLLQHGSLAVLAAIMPVAQTQVPEDPSDPLISHGSDLAIYIGLALLVLAIAFAIKSFSSKLEHVLVFAFGLSIMLVLVLWYL